LNPLSRKPAEGTKRHLFERSQAIRPRPLLSQRLSALVFPGESNMIDNSTSIDSAGGIPGRWMQLNLTWVAFFLTFVVWYNLGAFSTTIAPALHLSKEQSQVLLLCNRALTIPARIGVGMLVDRFGPRRVFTGVLAFAAFPCL